jgi:threonine/homoserine/homoserine lactone efflux protein
MAFVLLVIIAITLLRILIPILYFLLGGAYLVLWCGIQIIKDQIEKRRDRKEWREAQRANPNQ